MVGTVSESGDGGYGDQSSGGLIDCFSNCFLFIQGVRWPEMKNDVVYGLGDRF
jgi:hypothetical protein